MPLVKEVCHEVNGDNTIKTSHGTSKEKRIVISIKHRKVQFYKHVPKQLKTLFLWWKRFVPNYFGQILILAYLLFLKEI
jgi:hypothetical protein